MGIYEKLLNIQSELKAPKGQYNSFGKYKYRSCEDILEAVKPICKKNKAVLILSDTIYSKGERYYIEATATLIDTEDGTRIENTASAREEETKKGMDGSQITGTASSYARKYALNGLFCIDDTKDADTDEYKQQIDNDKLIDSKMVSGLNEAIEKASIDDKVVELILSQYGYTSTSEIKMKDYMNIIKDFKKEK
jgi:hypothetical protein